MMFQAEWRKVEGWNDAYEVSEIGQVRSIPRIGHGGRRQRGTYLKPCIPKRHYAGVNLTANGKCKFLLLHRIVAEAFLGPAHGRDVNHKDGNKWNNHVSNLEWVTRQRNIEHSFDSGLGRHGIFHPDASLNLDTVKRIKQMARDGECVSTIAKTLGLHYDKVYPIARGKTWRRA